MKTILIFIAICALFFTGCMDPCEPQHPSFSVDPGIDRLYFFDTTGEESYSYTVTIHSDDPEWNLVVSPANATAWCIVTPTTGTSGETFTITALPKLDANQRFAEIKITVGGERRTLHVIQEGVSSN